MNAFRLPGLVVVVGLLIGAVLIDQQRPEPDIIEQEVRLSAAAVRPNDALSSTWFCAAASGAGGLSESEIVLANTSPDASLATVTAFAGSDQPSNAAAVEEVSIELAGQSTTALRLADLLPDEAFVSVAVEVAGGGVLVEKISSGPTGVARSACTDDGSTEWVLTSGSTTPGSRMQLVVFNPFPDFATVDIDFVTSTGARSPEGLIGLPIPARSSHKDRRTAQLALLQKELS